MASPSPGCCSAPGTGTLPVPGVMGCPWQVAEQRGQPGDNGEVALFCPYSCAELCTGHRLHPIGMGLEQGEGVQGGRLC